MELMEIIQVTINHPVREMQSGYRSNSFETVSKPVDQSYIKVFRQHKLQLNTKIIGNSKRFSKIHQDDQKSRKCHNFI